MNITEWLGELVKPPKKGRGSSGAGFGAVDEVARKIKKRKEEIRKAADEPLKKKKK